MPNGELGKIHGKLDSICKKVNRIQDDIDSIRKDQEEQGTRIAVTNEHFKNLKGQVEDNTKSVKYLKKNQYKIIGIGIAVAFAIPVIVEFF